MDVNTVSPKHINQLEQEITQLLKTMRTAKLLYHPIYDVLQEFEQELAIARRKRYDKDNSEYRGY